MAHQEGTEAQGGALRDVHPEGLEGIAGRLLARAIQRRVTIATAESCTGGLVGHALTQIDGASAAYLGGVVSYADDVKRDLLEVPVTTLDRHGAVSAQVALAMAHGARGRLGADVAVAVTGVAGPSGGTPSKPVGLTFVAVADAAGHDVRRFVWSGDRATNKEASARAALELLLTRIEAASELRP